jgi:O-antigen/teichoic acid export membrane protein
MKIHRLVLVQSINLRQLFSDSTLTKKATLNAFAAGLEYCASLLVGFLITPLLVGILGDFYYGAWQFLLRSVGYISPASGRPTQALKWTLANLQNSTDYDLKRRYVGSTLLVWLIFLPLMIILGAILTWFVPYWIKAPANYFWSIRLASGLLVANLIFTTLAVIPQAILEGENKGYRRMGLSMLLIIAGGGITWGFLYLQTGIWGVATATFLTTLMTGFFYLSVAHTYSSWLGVAKPSATMTREFLGLSWWFLGWNFVMNLMTASDVILLGLLVSVEYVTNYTLSKYVPEVLISLVAIIVFGIIPGLGGIIGSGDLEKASKVRGEIMTLTWIVLTVLGTSILLWNYSFIKLWVGEEHFIGVFPNLLIVFVVYQFTFIRNDANIIDLTLRLRNKVLMGFISVAISLTIAFIFIKYLYLGVIGLCLGILIGRMILSLGYPLIIGRYLSIPWSSQLKSIIRPLIVTIFLFVFISIFTDSKLIESWIDQRRWIGLIISNFLTLPLFFSFSFFIGLNKAQRMNILRRLRAIVSTAAA